MRILHNIGAVLYSLRKTEIAAEKCLCLVAMACSVTVLINKGNVPRKLFLLRLTAVKQKLVNTLQITADNDWDTGTKGE